MWARVKGFNVGSGSWATGGSHWGIGLEACLEGLWGKALFRLRRACLGVRGGLCQRSERRVGSGGLCQRSPSLRAGRRGTRALIGALLSFFDSLFLSSPVFSLFSSLLFPSLFSGRQGTRALRPLPPPLRPPPRRGHRQTRRRTRRAAELSRREGVPRRRRAGAI